MATKGRPHKIYSEEQKSEINRAYKKSKNAKEKCRLLCIKLRVRKAMPTLQISEISGLAQGSVDQLISTYNRFGIDEIKAKKQEGHNRNMTPTQEKDFLKPFLEKALLGQILVVNDIIKDYEKALHKKVAKSTVYDVLKRNGWRKIMPRSEHPKKASVEEIEAY